MNGSLLPMALLVAAIALSWPKFIAMFRIESNRATLEMTVISAACAICIGAIGLSLQQYGAATGGIMCALGVGAGQFLRKTTSGARL
jgi:hypothetical protein